MLMVLNLYTQQLQSFVCFKITSSLMRMTCMDLYARGTLYKYQPQPPSGLFLQDEKGACPAPFQLEISPDEFFLCFLLSERWFDKISWTKGSKIVLNEAITAHSITTLPAASTTLFRYGTCLARRFLYFWLSEWHSGGSWQNLTRKIAQENVWMKATTGHLCLNFLQQDQTKVERGHSDCYTHQLST